MSDEQDKLKLSLEAPKLFGRKRKAAAGTPPAEAPAKAAKAKATKSKASESAEAKASESAEAKASESKATAKAAEPEEAALAAAPEPAGAHPSAEPDAAVTGAPDVADDAVAAESPDAGLADTAPAAEATPADVPVDAEPTVVLPAADEAQKAPAAAEDEPTTVLPATSRDAATDPDTATDTATDAETATETTAAATPAPAPKSAAAAPATAGDAEPRRSLRERLAEVTRAPGSGAGAPEDDGAPLLTVYRAAALTGLIVGVALVVLTWLALRGCEAVRGTSSCGGGPGFLLLIATFAVCVYLGATLLRTFVIPDPGSSSFLAVGLVAVVSLLFLIDALGHWSMIIVIPVLSIGGFLASVWVTKTFVEPTEG